MPMEVLLSAASSLAAELGPEGFDMHIQGAGLAHKVKAPDLPEQLVPGHNPAAVGEQDAQQLILLEGEIQVPSALGDLMVIQVDDQIPAGEPVLPVFRRLTPQRRPHPGRQFQQAEGLGDIGLGARRVRGPRRLVLGQLEQRWQCGSRVP